MKINTVTQLIGRLKLEDGDSPVTLAIRDESNDYTLYGNLSPLKSVVIRSDSEWLGIEVIGGVFLHDSISTVEKDSELSCYDDLDGPQ